MGEKVIGLDGKPVVPVAEVNHGVVTLLERLLSEARVGRVSSVAVAYTVPMQDEISFQSDWCGPRITMLGAAARMIYAMNVTLDRQDAGRIGS